MNPRVQLIETECRKRRMPYVSVDEARRAMLPGPDRSRVQGPACTFHLVIYGPRENWLVYVGNPTPKALEGMAEWEVHFGEGFRAVFAIVNAGAGTHYFRALKGGEVEWPREDPPDPVALGEAQDRLMFDDDYLDALDEGARHDPDAGHLPDVKPDPIAHARACGITHRREMDELRRAIVPAAPGEVTPTPLVIGTVQGLLF